jgi:nucleoside-diphosphate-sugar epimerase
VVSSDSRVARAALAAGRSVRVCSRHAAKLEPLRLLGAEVRTFDAVKIRSFGPALEGASGATVLYAVPPVTEVPSGESLARATEAALHIGARSFIYLSSAGLYGDAPDETLSTRRRRWRTTTAAMSSYHTDESAVESASFAGLRTCTLRLAPCTAAGAACASGCAPATTSSWMRQALHLAHPRRRPGAHHLRRRGAGASGIAVPRRRRQADDPA